MPLGCCKRPNNNEFETYVRIICSLMTTLRRPEDKEYAQDILMRCTKYNNSGKADIRRYNNAFLAYFIRVLHATASTQPLEIYDQWYNTNDFSSGSSTRVWLEQNKSYFAMEKKPDGSVIFYSAVATDPRAGWDQGGLGKVLQKYGDNFLIEQIKTEVKEK